MFQMTPNEKHVRKATVALHKLSGSKPLDTSDIMDYLTMETCPAPLFGSVVNFTANLYAMAGGKFDKAGNPWDEDLYADCRNEAVSYIHMYYSNRISLADVPAN